MNYLFTANNDSTYDSPTLKNMESMSMRRIDQSPRKSLPKMESMIKRDEGMSLVGGATGASSYNYPALNEEKSNLDSALYINNDVITLSCYSRPTTHKPQKPKRDIQNLAKIGYDFRLLPHSGESRLEEI